MRLSNDLSLEELIRSETADRLGIDNSPSEEVIEHLQTLCIEVLQPIRDHFNIPITISSGYRNKALNKAVGGSKTSSHMEGYAVDIQCKNLYKVFQWASENLDYDQIIYEESSRSKWIHISYKSALENKNQVLLYAKGTYSKYN